MSPEIKMYASEADIKQIDEIKEYNVKMFHRCRKIQICTMLLTFLFIILALGVSGFYAFHDNAPCVALSFGVFLGLAVISQVVWRITDTLSADYLARTIFVDEDQKCVKLVLSGESSVSFLLDENGRVYYQMPDDGCIKKIYLDIVNEIPDAEKIVLKFTAQSKKVYGWYVEKGE